MIAMKVRVVLPALAAIACAPSRPVAPSRVATHASAPRAAPVAVPGPLPPQLDCANAPRTGPFDINGEWVAFPEGASAPAEVVAHEDCGGYPGGWILQSRDGDELESMILGPIANQGTRSREVSRPSTAVGRIDGYSVTIDGPESGHEVHYRLCYEPASGHLVGTKNGKPIVIVRKRIIRDQDCKPAP